MKPIQIKDLADAFLSFAACCIGLMGFGYFGSNDRSMQCWN